MKKLLITIVLAIPMGVQAQMSVLNDIVVDILITNNTRAAELEILTVSCDPMALVLAQQIQDDIAIAESITQAMDMLATGRDRQVIDFYKNYVFNRYIKINENTIDYLILPCPDTRLKGKIFFIKEGVAYTLGYHKLMANILN